MKLVPLKEAAQAIGLSCYALRKGTRSGVYPSHWAGGRYLYDVDMLEATIRDSMAARRRRAGESWES